MRYGLRMLRRSPGFSVAAVLILAMGIGANTALFSLIDAILIRQIPIDHADRLVWIWSTRTDRDKAFYSVPDFIETRAAVRTLEDMAAYSNWGASLTGSGESERFQGARVTPNAFTLMGVHAAYGRMIEPSDGLPTADRVAVLRHGLWQRRFGGDPNVIGHLLTLNGDTYRVIGVLPRAFLLVGTDAELFVPFDLESHPLRNDRETNLLRTMGLLKPGVGVSQAAAELASIERRLRDQYPRSNAKHTDPRVQSFLDEVTGGYRQALWTLLAAVSLVLFIACSNLANLMLTRASARRRELALRSALGASRAALFRQCMAESLVLAALGGLAGLALAYLILGALIYIAPADLPRVNEVALDPRVLSYGVLVTFCSSILFGLAPALRASRIDIAHALKSRGGGATQHARMRSVIVTAEVALSTVLMVAAVLFLRSFVETQAVDPGFDPDHVVAMRISLPQPAYSTPGALRRFYEALESRIARQPGVASVALASYLPLSGANNRNDFEIYGRKPASPLDVPAAQTRWISAAYFRAMRIPIREGREFDERDFETSAGVAIVDDPLARQFWPGHSPVGSHLRMDGRDFEVVGVAGGVKHATLDEAPTGTLYLAFPQVTPTAFRFLANGFDIVVRSDADPRALAGAVRHDLRALDPNVPTSSSRTMEDALALGLAPRRFNLVLTAVFAGAAVLLAVMGLYALMSYSVSLRSSEIGVRMALGADAGSLSRMVTREALQIILWGIGIGVAASIVAMRLITGLLFKTPAHDPETLVAVPAIFVIAGAVAAWVPARRAARIDPLTALRVE